MTATLFTRIINGDIPSHKVYEDDRTYAFMDIHPIQPGQVLVVPKNPVPYIWDLPEDDYRALMRTVQRVGRKMREVFPEHTHVGIQVEGLEVPHTHVKVFAFSTPQQYHAHPAATEPDHTVLAALAAKLSL